MKLLWMMLPDQRPYRELHWLSLLPGVEVTALGDPRPHEQVSFIRRSYRRPVRRFVEAGAFAWLRELGSVAGEFDWVASLELCSLVSGQARALARRLKARRAVFVWANDPDTPLYKLPPYSLAVRKSRGADLFLCFINAAKEHCVALGIPEERCAVVLPGVDVDLFHPAERPIEEPEIVFVSPLFPNKGIDRVLEAFGVVQRSVRDARLRVAGRGPLEGLVRDAAENSRGAIEYLGGLERSEVARALRGAAAFVTAPRANRVWNEQFGLAYIEAMASGLPVVTTICGSNHEAVREPNIRVPDDPQALAEALLRFLRDPSLRAEVGKENRRVVLEHHDLRRQCVRIGDAFRATSAR